MSAYPVFRRALLEQRWLIFWFALGLTLYGASILALYPLYDDYFMEALANYPEEILQFFGGQRAHQHRGFHDAGIPVFRSADHDCVRGNRVH
jgi:hypothetical protein